MLYEDTGTLKFFRLLKQAKFFPLLFLIALNFHFCALGRKLKLKTMLSVSAMSSAAGTGSSSGSASVSGLSSPAILNLMNKSSVESGFMIGTAVTGISSVEVSLDSGSYSSATGTSSWSYKFPTGALTWKEGTSHTISVRGRDSSGNYTQVNKVSVVKGKNKDINGDGYADLAAGAPGYSAAANKGAVYIFYSSGTAGISSGNASSAGRMISGQSPSDQFGYAVTVGDFNGDGYADIAAGAPGATGSKGKVHIFLSSGPSGIGANSAASSDSTILGGSSNDRLGTALTVGDVNGDGYADLIIGAYNYPSSTGNGIVYIFHSSSSGISASAVSSASASIPGTSNFDNFGMYISAGDVNGDGFCDLGVGASGYPGGSLYGAAYVFLSAGSSGITVSSAASANTLIAGGASGDLAGVSIALGDINGDGYADLSVGAAGYSTNKGRIYLFYSSGSSGITAGNFTGASSTVTGAGNSDRFGFISVTADLDLDGYSELLVGAKGYSGGVNNGAAYIFTSSGSGISASSAGSGKIIPGSSASDQLGYFIYTGDFNGDGYRDMAVSAYGYFTNSGAVYIFHSAGSSGITAGSPTGADTVLTGSSTNDNFGAALPEH